ncbi:TSUP family transporter [Desulfatibacillum aliphaticivorans]|uniref:TSUP family transporter n=1 Tax=Desulfatibacillum aliphaticivorans TaxID=218208 RepID=UPI000427B546|nr:TSUP family transporter [Desulfatibacillum aliphaticivorans]
MEFEFYHYAVFVLTGLCAGFVDSIAGGGGILTMPVLLAMGIPPHLALGTNKLQASFGSFTAAVNYSRKGLVSLSGIWMPVLFTAVGAAIGTVSIQMLSADFLSVIIPFLLAGIFFYTLLTPQLGQEDRKARMGKHAFYVAAGLLLGFYDGFFGPGTGSFWTIGLVLLIGLDLKKATAFTKIVNFTSNIVALIAFIIGGNVIFTIGILMGAGQMTGAYLGSRMVILRKVNFVRSVFLAVVGVTLVKLIWDTVFG